jgi:putative sterol carrier protein
MRYLSSEWHDMFRSLSADLPVRVGASSRVLVLISGSPSGDLRYHQVIEDGRIVGQANGDLADADVTLTVAWGDAQKIQAGEIDANAAMMQGKVKIAGNMAKVIALLPLTMSAEYAAVQAKVGEITDFD